MRAGSGIALNRVSRSRSAWTDCGKKPRNGTSAGVGERARPAVEIKSDESNVRIRKILRGRDDVPFRDRSNENVIGVWKIARTRDGCRRRPQMATITSHKKNAARWQRFNACGASVLRSLFVHPFL